jgi:hypothetical protein
MASPWSGLSGVVGSFAAVAIMAWMLKRVRPAPDVSQDGRKVLRYHRAHEILGWVGTSCFLLLLVALLLTAPPRDRNRIAPVFGGFALVGLFCIWLPRRCTVSYTETDVRYVPLFSAPFSFSWGAVVDVKYSTMSQWWVFRLADGRKARVSIFMNGRPDFIQTARRHVSVPIPDAIMPPGMTQP